MHQGEMGSIRTCCMRRPIPASPWPGWSMDSWPLIRLLSLELCSDMISNLSNLAGPAPATRSARF